MCKPLALDWGETTRIPAFVCLGIALAAPWLSGQLGSPWLSRLHAAETAAAPSIVPAASTDAASQVVLPPGKKLGEKSTVHRFVQLRAGAVKTAKGWNVQDFASSFFNPNAEEITVTMKLVADDPKFTFANGQVGMFTKTYTFRPMHGDTDYPIQGARDPHRPGQGPTEEGDAARPLQLGQ